MLWHSASFSALHTKYGGYRVMCPRAVDLNSKPRCSAESPGRPLASGQFGGLAIPQDSVGQWPTPRNLQPLDGLGAGAPRRRTRGLSTGCLPATSARTTLAHSASSESPVCVCDSPSAVSAAASPSAPSNTSWRRARNSSIFCGVKSNTATKNESVWRGRVTIKPSPRSSLAHQDQANHVAQFAQGGFSTPFEPHEQRFQRSQIERDSRLFRAVSARAPPDALVRPRVFLPAREARILARDRLLGDGQRRDMRFTVLEGALARRARGGALGDFPLGHFVRFSAGKRRSLGDRPARREVTTVSHLRCGRGSSSTSHAMPRGRPWPVHR